MSKQTQKTLILLETEAQVRDCVLWFENIVGEKIIIALTPFAVYELDKQNIGYKIIEEYCDQNELYNIGIDNFKKVEELCKIIDEFISTGKLIQYQIRPAFFSFYYLKMIYDSVIIRLSKLNELIEKEEPDVIIAYDTEKYPFGATGNAPHICFDNKESIYSQLLSLSNWGMEINMKACIHDPSVQYEANKVKYSDILLKSLKKWVTKNPLINDFAMVSKKKGFSGIYKYLTKIFFAEKKTPVILFGSGYNWDDCYDELHCSGIIPIYRVPDDFHWLDKSLKSDTKLFIGFWENLKNHKEFNRFFRENNVNFLPIFENRIQFLIEKITPACIFAYEDFSCLLNSKEIKAVISSTLTTPEAHSISKAAHNAGIPVVTWQHGGYGQMYHPILHYTELISSDVHFVFGKGVQKYMEQPAREYGTKLVTVGSSSLYNIAKIQFESENSPKKNILYITSVLLQNYLHITTFPHFEDNYYWNTQKAIINVLGKYTDLYIVLKQHPTKIIKDTPVRSYVADKGFNNFSFIKNESSVVDLISNADVIVIDFPFTTLLQALTTSKPIFVYLGHIDYDEDACFLLGKRAIYSKNLEDFKNKLDIYLNTGIYNADINNREFLLDFGTASPVNSAGIRAAQELKQTIVDFEQKQNKD